MLKYKLISSMIVIGLVVNFISKLNFNSSKEELTNEASSEQTSSNLQPPKTSIESNRSPASQINNTHSDSNAFIKRSKVDKSNFLANNYTPQSSYSGSNTYGNGSSSHNPNSSDKNLQTPPTPFIKGDSESDEFVVPDIANLVRPTESQADRDNKDPLPTGILMPKTQTKSTTVTLIYPKGSLPNPILPDPYSCSSSITGGSFSNPISISLSCTSISTIKYCVAIDTGSGCCDPLSVGSTYSTQIVIGSTNGDYCLSFYGETTSETSNIYEQSYTINSTLPNLQVAHPQINYQTTQLAGKTLITSTDYGKTGYGIGQINLQSHDPSPSGENLNCEEIISNYVALPSPAPFSILSLLDVSSDTPSVQIEIPLQPAQLVYGENFITSYMTNTNFTVPIYSCSTTNVTLNDFEFFQEELAFGDAGNNTVREFTGGLSPYGFFEDATTVYRGPAGENSIDVTGQKLEYGMFGIFY